MIKKLLPPIIIITTLATVLYCGIFVYRDIRHTEGPRSFEEREFQKGYWREWGASAAYGLIDREDIDG